MLVTLLALGIPTTATAAVMLSAFQRYDLQPGPRSSRTSRSGLGAAGQPLIGNVMLLVLNLPLAPLWARLLGCRGPTSTPASCSSPILGSYSVNQNPTDDLVLLSSSACSGFLMRRYGLPVVPAVIGVILGPTSEGKLRQALQASNGDWSTLWGTGFSIVMYVVIAGLLGLAVVRAVAAKGDRPRHERPRGRVHVEHRRSLRQHGLPGRSP